MFALATDVVLNDFDVRIAHCECPESNLPFELVACVSCINSIFVNPFRGVGLDITHRVGDGDRWRQANQQMQMIFDAAYLNQISLSVSDRASDVFVKRFDNFTPNRFPAKLGSENDVVR